MTPFDLFLITGTAARLTRLAVYDDAGIIIRAPIHKIGSALPGERGKWWAFGLLECAWCFGFWASVLVTWSWYLWAGMLWQAAAAAATASYVTGHLLTMRDEL